MAKVEMDLQELKAIENKVKEVQEQAQVEKKELQDKIDGLQKEKETLIQNQKRVMLTRTNYQIKYTIPANRVQTQIALQTALNWTCKYYHMNEFNYGFNDKLVKNVLEYMDNNNGYGIEYYETKDVVNGKTEDKYEFINLDEAINTALKQEDSDYMKEFKEVKKENLKLKKDLTECTINKEEEIKEAIDKEAKKFNKIKEEANERYMQTLNACDEKYKKLEEESSKKYKALEEESSKKYKALEEEFAKYKDDEKKMSMKDKLEKYQKENEELKKKIEEMDKKLKDKSLWNKIFG